MLATGALVSHTDDRVEIERFDVTHVRLGTAWARTLPGREAYRLKRTVGRYIATFTFGIAVF
jgi:hypothetical protein